MSEFIKQGIVLGALEESRNTADKQEFLRRKRYDMDRVLLPNAWMDLGIDPNKSEMKSDPEALPSSSSPKVLIATGVPLNVNDRKIYFMATLEDGGDVRIKANGTQTIYLKSYSALYENMAKVSILLAKCASDTK